MVPNQGVTILPGAARRSRPSRAKRRSSAGTISAQAQGLPNVLLGWLLTLALASVLDRRLADGWPQLVSSANGLNSFQLQVSHDDALDHATETRLIQLAYQRGIHAVTFDAEIFELLAVCVTKLAGDDDLVPAWSQGAPLGSHRARA